MSSDIKKIYIFTTQTLSGHVIVDVSNLSKNKFQTKIRRKFNLDELTFIYSADFIHRAGALADGIDMGFFSANSIKDGSLSLNDFFYKSSSNFGIEIYKANLVEVLNIISDDYLEKYEVNDEYLALIEEKERQRTIRKIEWDKIVSAELDFFSQYQSQYDKINIMWSEFWDQKIEIFRNTMIKNEIPERKSSIFFDDRNRKEFDKLSDKYVENLQIMTEKWREESRSLQSHLNVRCRHCDTQNKVKFKLIGPGNHRTYGGYNGNTLTEREYLLKPEYGQKLKPGRKYYWRSLIGLSGELCSSCNKSILIDSIDGYRLIDDISKLKTTDTCAIYPFEAAGSWFEWCGIWMTIFEWCGYEIKKYQPDLPGYKFFDDYNKSEKKGNYF